jgi:ABC-type multidrug transport system fused ATPase/permease subunit
MLAIFRPYFRILIRRPGDGARFGLLLGALFLAAVAEAIGVGLVLPFIRLLQDPTFSERVPGLRRFAAALGASTPTGVVLVAGAGLIAAFVLKGVYLATTNAMQMRFIYTRMVLASRQLLDGYLHKPYIYHVQTNSAEVTRDIISDTNQVFTYAMVSIFVVIVEMLTVIVVGALLVTLEPVAVPVAAVVMGGIALLLQRVFLRRTVSLGAAAREHQTSMMQWANQALGGIKEIQVLGCQDYFIERFTRAIVGQAEALRIYRVTQLLPRYVLETMGVLGLVGVTAVVLLRGGDPARLLPLLGVFAVAVVRILPSLARVAGSMTEIRYNAAASRKIAAELESVPAEARRLTPHAISLEHELCLRNVSVRYPGTTEFALSNVSFDVKRGEAIALVGPSGAGKTTIADVMIGLIQPTEGTLTIDGEALVDANRRAWQKSVGYIPQSVYLIDDSLRRNIAFGVQDNEVDGKRLDEAVLAAQLDEVVRAMPEGLSTSVGERGVRLSGGQRQRVGIARVLYVDAKLLVLDEATSALDGVTERDIVEAIDRLKGKRTMVIIAHRLSTVRNCDRLIHVEGGRVVGTGTWDQLETGSEAFRKLLSAVSARP